MTEEVYHAEDWPHGLRCGECSGLFVEGQPISKRLDAFQEDVPIVTIVCVPCGMAVRE